MSKIDFLISLKIQRNLKQDKIILAFGEKFELFLQIFDWVTPSIVIFQKSYKANFSSQDFKSKHFSLFRKVTFCQLWIADNKKFWEAWNLKLFFGQIFFKFLAQLKDLIKEGPPEKSQWGQKGWQTLFRRTAKRLILLFSRHLLH